MESIKTDVTIVQALTSPTTREMLEACKQVKLGQSCLVTTEKHILQFHVDNIKSTERNETKTAYYLRVITNKNLEKILVFTKIEGMYKGGFDTYIHNCGSILGLR